MCLCWAHVWSGWTNAVNKVLTAFCANEYAKCKSICHTDILLVHSPTNFCMCQSVQVNFALPLFFFFFHPTSPHHTPVQFVRGEPEKKKPNSHSNLEFIAFSESRWAHTHTQWWCQCCVQRSGAYATSRQPRCLRAIALKINGKHFVGCQNCWSRTTDWANNKTDKRSYHVVWLRPHHHQKKSTHIYTSRIPLRGARIKKKHILQNKFLDANPFLHIYLVLCTIARGGLFPMFWQIYRFDWMYVCKVHRVAACAETYLRCIRK